MDRVYHLGEDVAIDRGGMEAEAGSCLFMFLLHSGNRERHACMPSVQLPFCMLIQPRSPDQRMVPSTFRLGLPTSMKTMERIPTHVHEPIFYIDSPPHKDLVLG